MKTIAIIGSGISGLTCAYLLSQQHEVTLFEAGERLGGHTATVDVELPGESLTVDTGFIVFNDWTYPNFNKLLGRIGVQRQATEMSFSVQNPVTGVEYNGNNLDTLFAQRRNLLNVRFYLFLSEILRFNRLTKSTLQRTGFRDGDTLGEFLHENDFSQYFAEHYILPMVAAIWSASVDAARQFPLGLFLRFFEHHGLLNVIKRPQWYVIKGGSRSYIPHLVEPVQHIRLNSSVDKVLRDANGVAVDSRGEREIFDEVILACHSDQALKILGDRTDSEGDILGGLKYRGNEVVLHTDESLLPTSRKAWASWNFWLGGDDRLPPTVTYNMNILQGIRSRQTLCVTLNDTARIDPEKILGVYHYDHPVFDLNTVAAQSRREEICGEKHTHFCGAYWYNGFHEDGVRSALDVCQRFGVAL